MGREIRCYAFGHILPDGNYRNGTLLVGKNNETIIGNCIMKNPGSSKPLNPSLRWDGRMEFSVDATMFAVADLFQINKYGGAVRIYNLADLREANISKVENILTSSNDIDGIDNSLPTYLGFGNLWKKPVFQERAKLFFRIAQRTTNYLNPDMNKNAFYHPLYLMRYGKKHVECINVVNTFRTSLQDYYK